MFAPAEYEENISVIPGIYTIFDPNTLVLSPMQFFAHSCLSELCNSLYCSYHHHDILALDSTFGTQDM